MSLTHKANCGKAGLAPALLMVGGFLALPAYADGPNLVVNPGFETGDFTGYAESGKLNDTIVTSESTYLHSGSFGARIGPTGSDGFLTQVLATQAGQTYDITFFLYGDGQTPNDFNVTFGGTTVFSETNIPATGGIKKFATTGIATGPTTSFVLGFRNDPTVFGLDDISVTAAAPIPEASSGISLGFLLALGLGGLAWSARRRTMPE